jgi:hypothetical protein
MRALWSEWTKIRTLRPAVWAGVAAVVLMLAGALACGLSGANRPGLGPTRASLLGVTSEYATGMIHTSLAAAPRRGRLLVAKALVCSAITFPAGQAASFAAFLLGQFVLANKGLPHTALAAPGVLQMVSGTGLRMALMGPAGVGLGFLTRTTAGGFALLLAVTVLVPALQLPPSAGLGLFCAAVAVTLVAALIVFRRREL